jgi:hypothetical protein
MSFAQSISSDYSEYLAVSQDGKVVVTGAHTGGCYVSVSSNYGLDPTKNLRPCAASAAVNSNGSYIFIGAENQINISTDYGNTWTTAVPWPSNQYYHLFISIASDSDGSNVIAVSKFGSEKHLFMSSDYGSTWTEKIFSGSTGVYRVASDSDGSNLILSASDGIYISTDYGSTWRKENPGGSVDWRSVASDSDGSNLIVGGPGGVYTSTDYGSTWTARTPVAGHSIWDVGSNSTGSFLIAGWITAPNSSIYTSFDYGNTWNDEGQVSAQYPHFTSNTTTPAYSFGISSDNRVVLGSCNPLLYVSPGSQVGVCGPAATSYTYDATGYSGAQCTSGSSSNTTFPSQGTSTSWTCSGTYGGAASTCTASRANAPVTGTCGTANLKSYIESVTSYGTDTQCTAGTSTNTNFPAVGTAVGWYCNGSDGGSNSPLCAASRLYALNSEVVSSTIPTAMISGQSYNVNVIMKNIGSTTWTEGTAFRLGGVGDGALDTGKFGLSRIYMPSSSSIATNQQYTFSFTMTAPAAGTYNPQYRMVQDGVAWFGAIHSPAITVSPAPVNGVCGTTNNSFTI